MAKEILQVKDLTVQYKMNNKNYFNAVHNISFNVHKGEVVGLVGESGSGKSSTAKAILGLNEHSGGYIKLNGEFIPSDPRDIKGRTNKWLASKVQMIFQDAKSSLNPRETVLQVVSEGARNQKLHKKVLKYTLITDTLAFLEKYEDKTSYEFKKANIEWNYKRALELNQIDFDEAEEIINTDVVDAGLVAKSLKQTKRTRQRTAMTSYGHAQNQDKDDARKIVYKERIEKIKNSFDARILKAKAKAKILKAGKAERMKAIKSIRLAKNEIAKVEHDKKLAALKSAATDKDKKFTEAFLAFNKDISKHLNKKTFYRNLVEKTLKEVSISPDNINRYPGEFSGGQAQRIAIARTLTMKSDLIIADEPISALDVSIQAQVINILKDLIKKNKLTVLFIAHDLQMVKYISDRIIVMYKGALVEKGPADEIYNNPKHPYTKSLINAVPSIDNPKRIHNAKVFKPEHIITFDNSEDIKLEWHDVDKKGHQVFGTEEQFKKWTK